MVTSSGPLLHIRLRPLPPTGTSHGGLLEELFEERARQEDESEPDGPHSYRILGGNIVIVPQGFAIGGRLVGHLSSGAWSRMLRLSAEALRTQLD